MRKFECKIKAYDYILAKIVYTTGPGKILNLTSNYIAFPTKDKIISYRDLNNSCKFHYYLKSIVGYGSVALTLWKKQLTDISYAT